MREEVVVRSCEYHDVIVPGRAMSARRTRAIRVVRNSLLRRCLLGRACYRRVAISECFCTTKNEQKIATKEVFSVFASICMVGFVK